MQLLAAAADHEPDEHVEQSLEDEAPVVARLVPAAQASGAGYVMVSNQQADTFRIFSRAGTRGEPHAHPLLKSVRLSTRESDGSEVTSVPLPGFPGGLFVAMSTDRTFHFYAWDDIAAAAGWE